MSEETVRTALKVAFLSGSLLYVIALWFDEAPVVQKWQAQALTLTAVLWMASTHIAERR